jgi:hypothetical protein
MMSTILRSITHDGKEYSLREPVEISSDATRVIMKINPGHEVTITQIFEQKVVTVLDHVTRSIHNSCE